MSVVQSILLALQSTAFAVWAFFMFKTLLLLRRRGTARTGQAISGPGTFLSDLRNWLTAPEDRRDRLCLLASFIALTSLTFLTALRLG